MGADTAFAECLMFLAAGLAMPTEAVVLVLAPLVGAADGSEWVRRPLVPPLQAARCADLEQYRRTGGHRRYIQKAARRMKAQPNNQPIDKPNTKSTTSLSSSTGGHWVETH